MKIHPLDDRVVIEILDAEDVTPGGIVLPDTAKEKPQRGKVAAVGPGKLLDSGQRAKPTVGVGDVVLFAKYAGTEVRVGETEYTIMKESDVLAKEEGAAPGKKKKK